MVAHHKTHNRVKTKTKLAHKKVVSTHQKIISTYIDQINISQNIMLEHLVPYENYSLFSHNLAKAWKEQLKEQKASGSRKKA